MPRGALKGGKNEKSKEKHLVSCGNSAAAFGMCFSGKSSGLQSCQPSLLPGNFVFQPKIFVQFLLGHRISFRCTINQPKGLGCQTYSLGFLYRLRFLRKPCGEVLQMAFFLRWPWLLCRSFCSVVPLQPIPVCILCTAVRL